MVRKSYWSNLKDIVLVGCRHSSLDLSAPSILPPRVWVPTTPSTLFSIYIVQIVYLSIELECEKNKDKQKEAGIGPFFEKKTILFFLYMCFFLPMSGMELEPSILEHSVIINYDSIVILTRKMLIFATLSRVINYNYRNMNFVHSSTYKATMQFLKFWF